MKKPLLLGIIAWCMGLVVLSASMAAAQDPAARGNRSGLLGAWRLVSLEQPAADGQMGKVDCSGMLVFTDDGHMSVQVMDRNPQAKQTAGPNQYSQGGYEGSYGTYILDEKAHTFRFRVEGALVRSLVGKNLSRAYVLSGSTLVVKSTNANEHWQVTWERYP